MYQNVMLIDGNSLGNMGNALKPLKIGDHPVHAIYGFLRFLHDLASDHSDYLPIVLWDGHSWRYDIYPEYKANRKQAETPSQIKMQEQRRAYRQQVPNIRLALRLLGVAQVNALNMEADDLAAILTERYRKADKKVLLVTRDSDWFQLVDNGVVVKDLNKQIVIRQANFKDIVGLDNPQQLVEMKALAGEPGDNIKGVGGIGEKGAIEFLNTYGSFRDFSNRVIFDRDLDLEKIPSKFRRLVEDEDKALKFLANIRLIDLRSDARPEMSDFRVDTGTPNKAKFHRFCELLLFQSFLTKFDDWISVFPKFRRQSL